MSGSAPLPPWRQPKSSGGVKLGAVPKKAASDPPTPRLVDSDEEYPAPKQPTVQEFGSSFIEGRLQPRLPDAPWLNKVADTCDERKRKAFEAGLDPFDSSKATINPAVPIAGLPVPPNEAFGSRHLMEEHYRTYSPTHKLAANFNPSQHTVVLCGRPVQAIAITWEGAQFLERDPYLSWLLRPLKLLNILGYDASSRTSKPKGHKHFCVINWFQVIIF